MIYNSLQTSLNNQKKKLNLHQFDPRWTEKKMELYIDKGKKAIMKRRKEEALNDECSQNIVGGREDIRHYLQASIYLFE